MRRIAALGGLGLDQLAHARRHLIAGSLPDQQVLGLHTHKSIDQRQDHAHCDRCDVLEDLAALAGLLIAKPMFASSLRGHHYLVLTDGYYRAPHPSSHNSHIFTYRNSDLSYIIARTQYLLALAERTEFTCAQ